jgi:adenine phosphoribosyltransferase
MLAKKKSEVNISYLKNLIRSIHNYPKQGVVYRDITTLIKDKDAFHLLIDMIIENPNNDDIDVIVGIEARGFIIGSAIAYKMKKGFVPIRKKNKLPYKTIHEDYELEYGIDTLEIHTDSIILGQKILLIDDLLATGGTTIAAAKLINKHGGDIKIISYIIELLELNGRKLLTEYCHDIRSLIQY